MKRFFLLLFLFPLTCFAQFEEYPMGSLVDEAAYDSIPVKATQLTRSYTVLPKRASLRQYCPTPSSQGQYGTCVGWSVAYAARTIMEAAAEGRTDPATNAAEAFSPTFVYANIKNPNDFNCSEGSHIEDALKLLKTKGVPKKTTYSQDCESSIPSSVYTSASAYKIQDYFTVFTSTATTEQKVKATKMAISQGRPVIISMSCYTSFNHATTQWNGEADKFRGYHAMCTVGYDDEINGGSFLIMNSWGTNWGDNGFTWVKYSDFGKHVGYAFEMYLNPKENPNSAKTTLAGSMSINLATGGVMSAQLGTDDDVQVYKVSKTYPSGTRYRILLSNNEPAYVYVIGADKTGNTDVLFPPTPKVSPALVYASNDIAIPDEQWYIETDDTEGTDYLCVLYSKNALSIDDILSKTKASKGAFPKRLISALGKDCVANNDISFGKGDISFSTQSSLNIVPIIIEIPHGK